MVQSWYGGWNIWVYTESAWESHTVLLYEWLQNYFKTKEPIGREWCKILQKARTTNPSATTVLAVAQWQMSCLWKDLNTRKQHVENISQIFGGNFIPKWEDTPGVEIHRFSKVDSIFSWFQTFCPPLLQMPTLRLGTEQMFYDHTDVDIRERV